MPENIVMYPSSLTEFKIQTHFGHKKVEKFMKQAGAQLGQAQPQLGLRYRQARVAAVKT